MRPLMVPSGASDHAVSEALYLDDPDGLGIEIYVDRPREQWERGPDGHGVRMVTLPLDVEDLLAQSPGRPGAELPEGTGIGHVHLKVSDVARADGFYRGLGFEDQAHLPSAAFVSAKVPSRRICRQPGRNSLPMSCLHRRRCS